MKCTKYCPYCTPTSDNRLLNAGTYDLSGIEVQIIGKSRVLRVRSYKNNDVGSLYENQEAVLIQYCPICGRNLASVDSYIYNEQWSDETEEL